MNYSTIRIEGPILSADILDRINSGDITGQSVKDFGFEPRIKVKDEIARAWADARALWSIFKRRRERVKENDPGTSETRKYWIIPLLDLLGFDAQYSPKAEIVNNQSYAISHRAVNRDNFPIHVMGFADSLDKKRKDGGPRMSPHALVQEYLNLTEHLYALVTNGLSLRVLRDSSRLIKLSFIEFDLQSMMEEDHYADFALMYRLIHISRMPLKMDAGAESLIEKYHQDALDSGSRIRDGLSSAVEETIKLLSNGFLKHPKNISLRESLENNTLAPETFYQYQMRLIYRVLFLIVIEERRLIFPKEVPKQTVNIYYNYYSVNHLCDLAVKSYLHNSKYSDLWVSLKNTFRLFEAGDIGEKLAVKPLAGDLFSPGAVGILASCSLDNDTLLKALKNLIYFTNPDTNQKMRVNYASLNVEEFGSVYEGLLEYAPVIQKTNGRFSFSFKKGQERSTSGSHYTPDELVQPLIRHSLDHVIAEKLKETNPEEALLSIKVCDVACGSGHILLNAARRIGTALARLRTGEDQPAPVPLRQAIRQAIRHCIYGVDKNPLAVELCKVALWLEAHNPGLPLNFLDHHIKCGDAIVGLAHFEELNQGIPDEAFKATDADEKKVASGFLKLNKKQREKDLILLNFDEAVRLPLHDIARIFKRFNALPENTPAQIEDKRREYRALTSGAQFLRMRSLSDIRIAQFFIPKTEENMHKITTDAGYRKFLSGYELVDSKQAIAAAREAKKRRFFHWFLEFPEVFSRGGFDCILGNPPYLGGQFISGMLGDNYLNYIKTEYAPASGCDLVTYFVRRNFTLIKQMCFVALITTNSISEGRMREGGLNVIVKDGGTINYARRSVRWPGVANLYVSLFTLIKGNFVGKRLLDDKPVDFISPYFDDVETVEEPFNLAQNQRKIFQGSIFLGDGFLLTSKEKDRLIALDEKNQEVIFPVLNGRNLNESFNQKPERYIINFFDWSEEKAKEFTEPYTIIKEKVKPVRDKVKRKSNRERWWIYAEHRPGLYSTISNLKRCFAVSCTTKYLNFSICSIDIVFTHALFIYAYEKFDSYTILQSNPHEVWARKHSSKLKTDLRYTPSDCFETFPFPQDMPPEVEQELEEMGEKYHEFRRQLMLTMKLGLTKTYNQFHNSLLSTIEEEIDEKEVGKKYGKATLILFKHLAKTPDTCSFNEAVKDIMELRRLHKQMDEAVLKAYGWQDVDLAHDFYEVDYLPENDRIRYTISPPARKEILKRLLELNHQIHQQEVDAGLVPDKTAKKMNNPPKKEENVFAGPLFTKSPAKGQS